MRFHYPPDPNLIEVPLGPAWLNETGRIAMRLPRKQVTNAPEGFLNEEQFVERLLTAQGLVLADRLAKWTKGSATTTTRSPTRIPSCLDRFSNRGNATMLGSIKSSN